MPKKSFEELEKIYGKIHMSHVRQPFNITPKPFVLKRRGRPRKNDFPILERAEDFPIPGRPRKVKEPFIGPHKKRGRPRKVKEPFIGPHKKRGRPRKVKEPFIGPHKKRGRPRKVKEEPVNIPQDIIERHHARHQARTTLASALKRRLVQNNLMKNEEAATRIQKILRGHVGRSRALQAQKDYEPQSEFEMYPNISADVIENPHVSNIEHRLADISPSTQELAATKIANIYRKRLANLELARTKAAHVLGGINKNREAGTVLQSSIRGMLARNKLMKVKQGLVEIKQMEKQLKKSMAKSTKNKAEKELQSAFQSAFRNNLAKIELVEKQDEAYEKKKAGTRLQSSIRGALARNKYHRLNTLKEELMDLKHAPENKQKEEEKVMREMNKLLPKRQVGRPKKTEPSLEEMEKRELQHKKHLAAIKIQTNFRGHQAGQKASQQYDKKIAASYLQNIIRSKLIQNRTKASDKKIAAASHLQNIIRSKLIQNRTKALLQKRKIRLAQNVVFTAEQIKSTMIGLAPPRVLSGLEAIDYAKMFEKELDKDDPLYDLNLAIMTNKYVMKHITPFIKRRLNFTSVKHSLEKIKEEIRKEEEEAQRIRDEEIKRLQEVFSRPYVEKYEKDDPANWSSKLVI